MRGAGLQMPRAKTPQGRFGEETSLRQPAHSSSATACSWLPTETWAGAHVDEMPQRSPAQPGQRQGGAAATAASRQDNAVRRVAGIAR